MGIGLIVFQLFLMHAEVGIELMSMLRLKVSLLRRSLFYGNKRGYSETTGGRVGCTRLQALISPGISRLPMFSGDGVHLLPIVSYSSGMCWLARNSRKVADKASSHARSSGISRERQEKPPAQVDAPRALITRHEPCVRRSRPAHSTRRAAIS